MWEIHYVPHLLNGNDLEDLEVSGTKTLLFEKECDVSIDDFEDIVQIDRFLEKRLGHPLKVTDRRTSLTMRGGHVLGTSSESREELESAISSEIKALEAQRVRLQAQKV
jgi:hypothetical protein